MVTEAFSPARNGLTLVVALVGASCWMGSSLREGTLPPFLMVTTPPPELKLLLFVAACRWFATGPAGSPIVLLSTLLRLSIVYPLSFACTTAYCSACAFSVAARLAIERLGCSVAASFDKSWFWWPIMSDSTRDLLSAVVSCELRWLGVLGLS